MSMRAVVLAAACVLNAGAGFAAAQTPQAARGLGALAAMPGDLAGKAMDGDLSAASASPVKGAGGNTDGSLARFTDKERTSPAPVPAVKASLDTEKAGAGMLWTAGGALGLLGLAFPPLGIVMGAILCAGAVGLAAAALDSPSELLFGLGVSALTATAGVVALLSPVGAAVVGAGLVGIGLLALGDSIGLW